MAGRHAVYEGPVINRFGIDTPSFYCSHPVSEMEWRRDYSRMLWVGICARCGRGRTFELGNEPFVVTDEQIARDLFKVPVIYAFMYIPYESW